MKKVLLRSNILIILGILIASNVYAMDIFAWSKCGGRCLDPVYDEEISSITAITRTLDSLHIDYYSDRTLPDNINDYDVVIVALGFQSFG